MKDLVEALNITLKQKDHLITLFAKIRPNITAIAHDIEDRNHSLKTKLKMKFKRMLHQDHNILAMTNSEAENFASQILKCAKEVLALFNPF